MKSFILNNYWLYKIIVIALSAALLSFIEGVVYYRLQPRLKKTHFSWDNTLIEAIHRPLSYFIWIGMIVAMTPIVLNHYQCALKVLEYYNHIIRALFIIFVFWVSLRYVKLVENSVIQKVETGSYKRNKTRVHAMAQLSRAIIIVFVALTLMSTMGIQIGTFLAFGGVGALAISFAAKDTLQNFFGGLMIYTDRPFEVGEWIRSPDKNIEGTVEYIGWRMTRIRTFDKRPLYVPNGTFLTISIENPGRMLNRRIKTHVGIRYQDADKMDVIIEDIKAMLANNDEISKKQIMLVCFDEFGPSSLNILIYTFTNTTNWARYLEVQQDVFLKIIKIIKGHGADCAFPTMTLESPDGLIIKNKIGA